MIFLPIFIFGVGIVNCVHSSLIPAVGDEEDPCPPPSDIAPCTCFKDPDSLVLTAKCSNFNNTDALREVFQRNPDWEVEEVWIENATLSYLSSEMMKTAVFQSLYVTSSTFVTLFDKPTVATPELNLYLTNVKILRGFQWQSFSEANLKVLKMENMSIKTIGQDFKDNIPKGVEYLWFENTGVRSIGNQAFADLPKLQFFLLKGGNIKKVSRNMFPNPWIVYLLDLSYQKIAALPEDFFTGMPKLFHFKFDGNQLTTISDKVFIKPKVYYDFKDNPIECNCLIKWILDGLDQKSLTGACVKPESLKGVQLKDLTATNFKHCRRG